MKEKAPRQPAKQIFKIILTLKLKKSVPLALTTQI